jgi:hypothetical protein
VNKYMVEDQEFFQLNEKLKEELVLKCEAFEAKTVFYPNGFSIVPYAFYETIVRWHKDVDENVMVKSMKKILKSRKNINDLCEMSMPTFETAYGHPQIVWAIFPDNIDTPN